MKALKKLSEKILKKLSEGLRPLDSLRKIFSWSKKAGHFYILIIPAASSRETRSHKFSPKQILAASLIYSMIIGFLGFLLLRISPIDQLLFGSSTGLSKNDKEVVSELDKKLKEVSIQLQNLKVYNWKLRSAILLADSSLLESPSGKQNKSKIKVGGNIFAVFKDLFSPIITGGEESVFFTKPVNGYISRDFYPEKGHNGIDFILKTGTPVYASANGYIVFADYTEQDGYKIIINHPGNYLSVYKHCSQLLVKEKESVTQGQLIALSGNSGDITTGPHLHFEIWLEGKPVDPKKLLIDY
jgi:murein DD-endopeptidase MepM/ murein hydrolase activator NlpD